MRPQTRCRILLHACLLALLTPVTCVRAQVSFTTPDKSLSFNLPEGWQAEADGGKVRLTSRDGTRYLLTRDTLPLKPQGEPTTSAELRKAAEELVKPLLSTYDYAGVRPLKVNGGSGAIFRFRGKGSRSDSDLVEVRIGYSGSHSAVVVPEAVPPADHSYGLGVLFQSLTFSGPNTVERPTAGRSSAKQEFPGEMERKPAQPEAAVREKERYEGHLIPGDISFKLTLMHGGSAKADWMRSPDRTARYAGTYVGEDGNYSIKLQKASETGSMAPGSLNITTSSLGGMVKGNYTADAGSPKRDVAELKLTSVDAPNIRLRGVRPGANRANARRGNNNSNSMVRGTMRRDTRMRNNARRAVQQAIRRRR